MVMPTVSKEAATALIESLAVKELSPAEWLTENLVPFKMEQPVLLDVIIANVEALFPDGVWDGEVQAKALFLTLLVYKVLKNQVEVEDLEDLFAN